jgi:predicted ATPase
MPPEALYLSSVKLERFKAAFRPPAVRLGKFNLIVGRNGSGKSTLLEALQWVDRTLRQDARTALERYFGIHDVINVRSQLSPPAFRLTLGWTEESSRYPILYEVQVSEANDGYSPLISSESLYRKRQGSKKEHLIKTQGGSAGVREVNPGSTRLKRTVADSDRLALDRADRAGPRDGQDATETTLSAVRHFWTGAVFLRLSTQRLAAGSPASRKSFEPLLDEEGNSLPALLTELNDEQRSELVERVQGVLQGIEGIEVDRPRDKRDEHVNYALKERIVRTRGVGAFRIPSWMLSEGTRRITAIFALLVHDPPPSLLCVEEIENGLDPWTVIKVLDALRSAAAGGMQVIVTTHSPWLMDHVDIGDIIKVSRADGETSYQRFSDIAEMKEFAQSVPAGARYVNSR